MLNYRHTPPHAVIFGESRCDPVFEDCDAPTPPTPDPDYTGALSLMFLEHGYKDIAYAEGKYNWTVLEEVGAGEVDHRYLICLLDFRVFVVSAPVRWKFKRIGLPLDSEVR